MSEAHDTANPAEIDEPVIDTEAEAENDGMIVTEADAPDGEDDDLDPETGEARTKVDDDTEEVDVDGVKHRVPKAVMPRLMMQADYTKKTMEVAKDREALAAETTKWRAEEATRVANLSALEDDYGLVHSIRAQIKAYTDADIQWDAAYAAAAQSEDPARETAKVNAAFAKLQTLERQLAQAQTAVTTKTDEITRQAEAAAVQERTELGKALHEAIPDFQAAFPKIVEAAASLGVSVDDLAVTTDKRTWLGLNQLRLAQAENAQLRAQLKTRTTVQGHERAQTASPAATVRGASPPAGQLSDRQSDEAWIKTFNAQRAKRG